jgi:hypothetical protein
MLLDMIGVEVFRLGRLLDDSDSGLFASSCDDSWSGFSLI